MLRQRRRALGLNAVTTAEAAGLSRVTLRRIERGHPSVTIGAYVSVAAALGLTLEARDPHASEPSSAPESVPLAKYPQLRRLAWHLAPEEELTPEEALELYERNWRHLDQKKLSVQERALVKRLLAAFGRSRLLV